MNDELREPDYDEGIACCVGVRNVLFAAAVAGLAIAVAFGLTGCEATDSGDEEKTEITAQSGSTVIVNTGDGTATVQQSEEVASEAKKISAY